MTVLAPPRLLARTVEVDLTAPLVSHLPADVPPADLLAWVREGEGLVGWGRAASCRTEGTSRFRDAEDWWLRVSSLADVEDPVGEPGSGLVAFGSFSFSPDSGRGGTLVVPEVVVGRRGGRCWVTTVTDAEAGARAGLPPGAVDRTWHRPRLTVLDGAVPASRWPAVVAAGVRRIEAGEGE